MSDKIRDFIGKAETIIATGYQYFQEYVDSTRGRATTQSLSVCQQPDYYIAKAAYHQALDDVVEMLGSEELSEAGALAIVNYCQQRTGNEVTDCMGNVKDADEIYGPSKAALTAIKQKVKEV